MVVSERGGMVDQIAHYSLVLAAKYGNRDPWIPHKISAEEQQRFSVHLSLQAVSAQTTIDSAVTSWAKERSALRAINVPQLQPDRRLALETDCIAPLRAAGVDAAFHDGCMGKDLPLDLHELSHGGVQSVQWNGIDYIVDTTLWKGSWTHEELDEVERRQAMMDWFPLAWLNFRKDVLEPQTPGFVGGHISHVEVWRWAHAAGLNWVMVLEDDATPSRAYGLSWVDTWLIVSAQVACLQDAHIPWDILYVGRTPSYTREGREVTPLIVPVGYCLRTHTYCLSSAGLRKLLQSEIATTITHRPQDEILATLTLLAAGLWHPRADVDAMVRRMAPKERWLALAFKGDGITSPLEDVEDTARARSDTAPEGSHRAAREDSRRRGAVADCCQTQAMPYRNQSLPGAINMVFELVD